MDKLNENKKMWCWIGLGVFAILLYCLYVSSCNNPEDKYRERELLKRRYFKENEDETEERISRCPMERFAPSITGLNVVEEKTKENFSGFSINK